MPWLRVSPPFMLDLTTMQIPRALISGSTASVVSTLALGVSGAREEGSAAGPINGPSQWLWGEAEAHSRRWTWRHTAVGYAIHHAMSVLWANAFEQMQEHSLHQSREQRLMKTCANAATVATLAYIVDYGVAPRRLRPGFKKHLGPRSIFLVYAAFGVGLGLGSLLVSPRTNASRAFGHQPERMSEGHKELKAHRKG